MVFTQLYGFWLFGIIIHLLLKLKKAYTRKDFSWKIFGKKHLWGTIIVLVAAIPLILLRDKLEYLGLSLNELTCLLLAYSGDSGIKKFLDKGSDKLQKDAG